MVSDHFLARTFLIPSLIVHIYFFSALGAPAHRPFSSAVLSCSFSFHIQHKMKTQICSWTISLHVRVCQWCDYIVVVVSEYCFSCSCLIFEKFKIWQYINDDDPLRVGEKGMWGYGYRWACGFTWMTTSGSAEHSHRKQKYRAGTEKHAKTNRKNFWGSNGSSQTNSSVSQKHAYGLPYPIPTIHLSLNNSNESSLKWHNRIRA